MVTSGSSSAKPSVRGGDDVLHRGGTAGGDIAGQRSRRRSGSCGAGCGGRRGRSGRSCTAAGGQGSSSGSGAADGQERTTSDLFHNNISFNWAGPFVLAGLFSFSSLYLSWDAFIVAHRPSGCDHGGAKMQVKLCAVFLRRCYPLVKSVWKTGHSILHFRSNCQKSAPSFVHPAR